MEILEDSSVEDTEDISLEDGDDTVLLLNWPLDVTVVDDVNGGKLREEPEAEDTNVLVDTGTEEADESTDVDEEVRESEL